MPEFWVVKAMTVGLKSTRRELVGLKVERCGVVAIVCGVHSCWMEERELRVLEHAIGTLRCTLSAGKLSKDKFVHLANSLYSLYCSH